MKDQARRFRVPAFAPDTIHELVNERYKSGTLMTEMSDGYKTVLGDIKKIEAKVFQLKINFKNSLLFFLGDVTVYFTGVYLYR